MSQVLAGFTVESTDDEIKSMPLKSPLRIKFEKEINIVDALGKISVLSLGDKNDLNDIVKTSGDTPYDKSLFYPIELKTPEDDKTIVYVYPQNVWENGRHYRLYVPSGVESVSDVESLDERVESFISSDYSEYKIEIKSASNQDGRFAAVLSSSTKTGILSLYYTNKALTIGTTSIKFKDNAVLKAGEVFTFKKSDVSITVTDFYLDFYTVSGTAYGMPEIERRVITEDDVKNFLNNPLVEAQSKAEKKVNVKDLYTVSGRLPNKVIIDFDESVDISGATLKPENFEIREAYDNIALSKMGLYNKDAQYDFSIRIREALNRIELTIKELTEEEIAAKELAVENGTEEVPKEIFDYSSVDLPGAIAELETNE